MARRRKLEIRHEWAADYDPEAYRRFGEAALHALRSLPDCPRCGGPTVDPAEVCARCAEELERQWAEGV